MIRNRFNISQSGLNVIAVLAAVIGGAILLVLVLWYTFSVTSEWLTPSPPV